MKTKPKQSLARMCPGKMAHMVTIVSVVACFRCVVLISLCSVSFPLCCANFVVLRLVSIVLWRFRGIVHY